MATVDRDYDTGRSGALQTNDVLQGRRMGVKHDSSVGFGTIAENNLYKWVHFWVLGLISGALCRVEPAVSLFP